MRDSFNEINITPLTDIFLVLLIIMMVIAPLLDQQGLNLAVPEVVNQEQITKDPKIMTRNCRCRFRSNSITTCKGLSRRLADTGR